jgi:hypothetical protein
MLTVESQATEQQTQYSFQNEDGEKWAARIENKTLYIEKEVAEFKEIQLTLEAVQAELDGIFTGDYDFENSCSLRTCEFTRAESYWILSVLTSASHIMKNIQ